MEKRLLLAIGLSLLVLLSWSAFVSKSQHIGNKDVIAKESTVNAAPPTPSSLPSPQENVSPLTENLIKFDHDLFEIIFNEQSASIKEIIFKKYMDSSFVLKNGFMLAGQGQKFRKESETGDSIVFVSTDAQKTIVKKFIFSKYSYIMELQIKQQNLNSTPLPMNNTLILGDLDFSFQNKQARFQDLTISTPEKVLHANAQKIAQFPSVKFLSLRDRYFCLIISPKDGSFGGYVQKTEAHESEIGLSSPEITIPASSQIGQLFSVYIGPQDLKILNAIRPEWTSVIYFGTFDIISQVLLQTLEFIYKIFHNWGCAIILLSILVYALLYPLSIKQMRSMKEMQAIQPMVEELRNKYKDNPQKMNKEMMELYRIHKVNPFGGCLPLILQMPIFFALYNALMRSIALRGARFLWIKDLSQPDRLFILPISLPILGNEFNILPIIMAIGMFIQQKISMTKTADSAAAEQQKMMMLIMPIMFGFIFYNMPSGLVLYWLVNSMLMLVFQIRMSKAT